MDEMPDHGQHDRKSADRQYCVGGKGSNSARANHGGDNGNAHDQGQMQQAAAMSMMVGEMVVVRVSTMSVPAMAMTAPALVFFLLAFVERKFLAHADIQFTHVIPYVSYGPIGRNESIII